MGSMEGTAGQNLFSWRTEMSSGGGRRGVEFAALVKSLCRRCPLGKQLDNTAAAQGKNGAQGRSSRVGSLESNQSHRSE